MIVTHCLARMSLHIHAHKFKIFSLEVIPLHVHGMLFNMCNVSNKCGHSSHSESTWRDGAVTVKNTAVLDVLWDLQEVLRCKKNMAAKTILALNAESGITIRSWGPGVKHLMGEVAGEGASAYLIKMAGEDPTHLQSLLERAEHLLQGAEKGEIHLSYSYMYFKNTILFWSYARKLDCQPLDIV